MPNSQKSKDSQPRRVGKGACRERALIPNVVGAVPTSTADGIEGGGHAAQERGFAHPTEATETARSKRHDRSTEDFSRHLRDARPREADRLLRQCARPRADR